MPLVAALRRILARARHRTPRRPEHHTGPLPLVVAPIPVPGIAPRPAGAHRPRRGRHAA